MKGQMMVLKRGVTALEKIREVFGLLWMGHKDFTAAKLKLAEAHGLHASLSRL